MITFSLLLISAAPAAFAHPFLEESNPSASTTVSSGVEQVVIHFSEAVDLNFSVIKILDSNGNQVDNKDTEYFEKESSLVVTTPPLEDGVYTVTTKVLSKIDGHLVDYAFIFGIGDVRLDTSILDDQKNYESVFVPESLARYPGLVGQTIVLGSAISSILIWKPMRKMRFFEEKIAQIDERFNQRFSLLFAVGIGAVLASNFAMLAVQTWRLDAASLEALQTTFGNTWLIRMIITAGLVVTWFAFRKIRSHPTNYHAIILVLSLLLIGTTTMMGHGAASEQIGAVILDYVHNLLSAVWIGGIILLCFVLLPALSKLHVEKRDKTVLAIIPRYSTIIVMSLGILFVTGPTLLWFFESDVNSLTNSSYGFILISKIVLGIGMISIGGYNQFKIFKEGRENLAGSRIFPRLNNTLRIEIMFGLALLFAVAFLTNTGLPAGEIDLEAAATRTDYRFTEYSESTKFDISFEPFSTGKNLITLTISDLNGGKLSDLVGTKIKLSNPSKNITPIEIPTTATSNDAASAFQGEITFGFSGTWSLEIEAQRSQQANENIRLNVLVKPDLDDIKAEITEIDFPEEATPLYPVFDNSGNIWISDPMKPRIWKYSISDEGFSKYDFEGSTSITLTIDKENKVWFTDIPNSSIGNFDPKTENFEIIKLPEIRIDDDDENENNNIPIALLSDSENNIWISVTNKNVILKYDQNSEKFEKYVLPTENSGPFALELGPNNNIWFTESIAGKVGYIDTKTKEIAEFSSKDGLQGPEELVFDRYDNLWIAEHTGNSVSKFNPVLETFERITVPDSEALPFGMVFDRYENIWFAQHVVDKIGVYDPQNNKLDEIEFPSTTTFVQFVTADDDGNIWAVEQQTNKLAKIQIIETPNLEIVKNDENNTVSIKYAELVAPLLSLGIILTSILFVKGVQDRRQVDKEINMQ